jgi:hypothetical protein
MNPAGRLQTIVLEVITRYLNNTDTEAIVVVNVHTKEEMHHDAINHIENNSIGFFIAPGGDLFKDPNTVALVSHSRTCIWFGVYALYADCVPVLADNAPARHCHCEIRPGGR